MVRPNRSTEAAKVAVAPPYALEVGARIRCTRELFEITQAELAQALGVNPSAVSHYESGNYQMQYDAIVRFVFAFGVDANWLLYGDTTGLPRLLRAHFEREFPDLVRVRSRPYPMGGLTQPEFLRASSPEQPDIAS